MNLFKLKNKITVNGQTVVLANDDQVKAYWRVYK